MGTLQMMTGACSTQQKGRKYTDFFSNQINGGPARKLRKNRKVEGRCEGGIEENGLQSFEASIMAAGPALAGGCQP